MRVFVFILVLSFGSWNAFNISFKLPLMDIIGVTELINNESDDLELFVGFIFTRAPPTLLY